VSKQRAADVSSAESPAGKMPAAHPQLITRDIDLPDNTRYPLIVLQGQQIRLPAKFHGDGLTIYGHHPGAIDTIANEERATID
jgi:hypothetical protein